MLHIPPSDLDVSSYTFDARHIFEERGHNVDLNKALKFKEEAIFMLEKWDWGVFNVPF